MMYAVTLKERLALLIEQAPALRAAGIASVEIHGERMAASFAPPFGPTNLPVAVPVDEPAAEPEPEPALDALDDPATYEDGIVPGYVNDNEEDEA